MKIAVLSLSAVAQSKLIDFIAKRDPQAAEWYRDNWTGDKGRYCACHAGYAGSNNNMGVEVDWRDVKKLCPARANLGTFIGALMHFIKQLGTEHQQFLIDQGTPNAFISQPVPDKAIWDRMQEFHPKTLSCCFVVRGKGGNNLVTDFFSTVEDIMGSGEEAAPIHLKIRAWHGDMELAEDSTSLKLSDIKTLLMPRQHILKRFDPFGTKSVEEVTELLYDAYEGYLLYVIKAEAPPDEMSIEELMDIYETFHMLSRATSWGGKVPVSCTCLECIKNCVCCHGVLMASVFDKTLVVPDEYVAAEPSARKKTKLLKGSAGPRRARLLKEIAAAKGKSESKLRFLDMASEFLDVEERSDDEVRIHITRRIRP